MPPRHDEDYVKTIAEEKSPIQPFEDELSFKSDKNSKPVLSLVDSGSVSVTASTRGSRSTNSESSSLMVTVSCIDEETQKLEIEESKSLIGSFDDELSFKSDENIRPDLSLVDSVSTYATASTRGSRSTNTESSSLMVTLSRIDEETQSWQLFQLETNNRNLLKLREMRRPLKSPLVPIRKRLSRSTKRW
jgi:hypothetical protein